MRPTPITAIILAIAASFASAATPTASQPTAAPATLDDLAKGLPADMAPSQNETAMKTEARAKWLTTHSKGITYRITGTVHDVSRRPTGTISVSVLAGPFTWGGGKGTAAVAAGVSKGDADAAMRFNKGDTITIEGELNLFTIPSVATQPAAVIMLHAAIVPASTQPSPR
jgi:hypothetical protein